MPPKTRTAGVKQPKGKGRPMCLKKHRKNVTGRGDWITPEERGEIVLKVCKLIAEERMSSYKACKIVGVPPETFHEWTMENDDIRRLYFRARETMYDGMANDIIEISDMPIPKDANGKTDSGRVAQLRLMVDSRKWILSKLAPKKYGDKLTLQDPDGNAVQNLQPVTINVISVPTQPKIIEISDNIKQIESEQKLLDE